MSGCAEKSKDFVTPSEQKLEDLYHLIDGVSVAMMTTRRPDGFLVSRAMKNQQLLPGCNLWFVGSKDSKKMEELRFDPHVNLSYYKEGTNEWVSVSGTAELFCEGGRERERERERGREREKEKEGRREEEEEESRRGKVREDEKSSRFKEEFASLHLGGSRPSSSFQDRFQTSTQDLIKQFYSPDWRAWFGDLKDGVHDGGPNDPRICLIFVEAHSVTYLKKDPFSQEAVETFKVVKAIATGEPPKMGNLREISSPELHTPQRTTVKTAPF